MTKLSNLEHALIISYLVDEHVMLNIISAPDTTAAETSVTQETQVRLETGKNGVNVSKNGIITIKEAPKLLKERAGKIVTVVFYFKKLGMSFNSMVEKTTEGIALKIPEEISRLEEKESKEKAVTANLYFSFSGKKDISFSCESVDAFPLFKAEVWQSCKGRAVVNTAQALKQWYGMAIVQLPKEIYGAIEKTGQLLCKNGEVIPEKNMFDFDLCVVEKDLKKKSEQEILAGIKRLPYSLYMPLDREHCLCAAYGTETIGQETIERLLAAVSACSFVSTESSDLEPIENRVSPLAIAFISDSFIVLGGKTESFPLKKGQEYAIQISCGIPAGKRVIHTTLVTGEVISGAQESNCATVCAFTGVQAEDKRFLFEKLYGTIFK
jgi:hypothetical protein